MYNRLQTHDSLTLMMDAWSTSQNDGALGLLIMSVSENFEVHIETLAIREIKGRHTAVQFENMVKKVVAEAGLEGKVR